MGQTFALGQIYQPLRARCRRAGSPNDWALVRADAELRSWIESSLDGDAIRVVSGGPGAGKSSLARMLAAWCQANGEPVFYIPLHAFDLGQDLASAIIEAHRSEWHQSTGVLSFFEGDAALPVHDTDSLVLILDGLDELAAGGRAAERAVGTLFESVERLLRDHELPTRGRLRVLLLGREVVVQAHEARCRKPGQVLHLLPYFILPADVERYHDPKGLARHDQRHDWWRRYGELTGQDFDGLPAELDRPQLAELTAEPLLNLLVALTWEAGNLDFSRDDIGLPAIYADLVRQVFERSYSPSGKLHGVAGIKLDDYRQFLEAVAVAAWHGAGRTTTAEEIQEVAGRRLLAKMDVLQQGVEDGVGRLITAFYFRSQGEGDQGRIYEFTHQSFAEALLARRIMRFIERLERQARRWVEDDDGWDLETRLVEWYRLFGPAALDPNTVRFVRQEFAARGVEVTERWRGLLVEMLHAVIARDWPIETAGPRLAFREEVARGRHASAALLAMAAAASDILCTRVAIGPKQGPSVGFSVWWAALRRDGTLDGVLTMALRWWVFDANEISSHMNLEDCDLSHTLWDEGVEFVQDNLAGTLLYGVDLAGVWIEDCIWAGAKADGATVWPEGFDPQAAGVIVRETAP